jgi:4a-hydroxytetrahydrobiopterin dehydratase
MRPKKLSDAEVQAKLETLPGWAREGDSIRRELECQSYGAACALVLQTALAAERLDHHPDIAWSYRRVTVSLSTHDAGGLSELDFTLARQIESFSR